MFVSLLKGLCRGIDTLVMLTGKAAACLMPVLAAIVAYEVFSRYFLDKPTIWAYDLSLFLFGYIAALGGAYAQQKRAHINVDILYINVSPRTKRVFNLISFSLGIFFLWIVAETSLGKFYEALEFDYRRQSEWAPPMYHFWLMMLIACGLFMLQLTRDLLDAGYYLCRGTPLIEKKERRDGN